MECQNIKLETDDLGLSFCNEDEIINFENAGELDELVETISSNNYEIYNL